MLSISPKVPLLTFALLISGLACHPAAGAAEPLVIIDDGKPNAVIVVEADAPQSQSAAEVLAAHLKEMTGADVPVVSENDPKQVSAPVRLLVGHTQKARELAIDIPSGYDATPRADYGEEEGYVLKTVGNDLVIGGNNDGPYNGTHFAVYALLERLGCRFYMPGTWGRVIPKMNTITVEPMDITSRPDFAVRDIWMSGWVPITADERKAYGDWYLSVGMGGARHYPVAGDGFLAMLLPPDEYVESHPEFYAMKESGSRELYTHPKTGRYNTRHTMLCLSNPQVLAESIANIREALAGQRKLGNVTELGVGISPPDGAPFCYCELCKEANQNFNYPEYVHRPMQSEEYFGFSAELAKAFPDKFIATMAYSNREMPPQGIEPFPQNISVKHATISCDVLHPGTTHLWRRAEMMAMLERWRELTPHVVLRDYNPGMLVGMYVPERDMANIAINVPLYKKLDIKGMHREGRKVFMQTWLSYYITAKLLWDADADVETIKRDFYETMFGRDAGKHVQAWWDAYEAALLDTTVQIHEDWLLSHIITPELATKLRVHIDRAENAEATDQQKSNLKVFVHIAEHIEAYAHMLDAERRLDYQAAAEHAQAMFDHKMALHAIDPFLYTYHPKRGTHPEFTVGRLNGFKELAARISGETGEMVAPLPLDMNFKRDPYNQGVPMRWYLPGHDTSGWETKNTYLVWEQQDEPQTPQGHDYNGYGWYRADIDVPGKFAGRPISLYVGGAINEAWVWVNGRYAGHKPHKLWWGRNQQIELDITSLVTPGQPNTIAIRVHNDADVGGLFRRGFLWSPRPTDEADSAAEE